MSPSESKQLDEPGLILFPLLSRRKIAACWATSIDPHNELHAECKQLASDPAFMSSLKAYLKVNPIVLASCESMLAQLALAAGVKWQETAPVLQPLSRRGWHLGRWIPTFLLIDGPLGRLLRDKTSPLSQRLRARNAGLPLLSAAKDAFNAPEFRLLRNGFAHWSFEWIDQTRIPEIRIVDWETGKTTVQLSLLECEALHFLTFSVVRAIDQEILRR